MKNITQVSVITILTKSALSLLMAFNLSSCVDGITTGFNVGLTANDHPLLESDIPGYSQTQYPIVLVHGLYGFDDIFGMDYFYQIPQVLRNGDAEVYIAVVTGTMTPEIRGEQLITQLEDFSAISGKAKFNLFGHSLGAPTIRYVAAVRPDLVASVTSIAGVNAATSIAEWDKLKLPLVSGIVNIMGNALGHLIDAVSQNEFEQNIIATMHSMNDEGIAQFNQSYPDGLPASYCGGDNSPGSEGPFNGIYYYSWAGNKAATNGYDPLDLLHKSTSKLIDGDDDDGMVPRCATHLGFVIKDDYPMNHLDHMNWFMALRDDNAPYPPTLYRAQANRLKGLGL
ncbi:MAG: triacylglycerol lipase [Pseudomonadales bacterium]|nr:triacylglycerol lipase [Pseudomonadales bacterium]